MARSLVGTLAHRLILLGAGIPQIELIGNVAPHDRAAHRAFEGDANFVRADEPVVGLHEHQGECQVPGGGTGIHDEGIAGTRQQGPGSFGTKGSVEHTVLDTVLCQRGSYHTGIAVFRQVFKAGGLDGIEIPKQDAGMGTGHEERTGLVGQGPDTGGERCGRVALIRNVGDGHHKSEVFPVGTCIEWLGSQHRHCRQQPNRDQRGHGKDCQHLVQMNHQSSFT